MTISLHPFLFLLTLISIFDHWSFLYLIAIYIKKDQQSIQFLTIGHFSFLYFQHSKSCQNFQIHVLYIVSELDTDVLTFHVYNDALTEFLMLYNHAFTKCIRKFLIAFSRLLLRSMPGAISMIHSISLYAICSRRTIISPFFYSCIFFLLILSQIPLSQQLTAEFGRLIRRKYIQLILCSGHTYIEESSFFLISFKFFL